MTELIIKVEKSCDQIIAGIPKSVIITTNIPATIFYTTDGTTPTTLSNIYVGNLYLPYNQLVVTLNILAVNVNNQSATFTDTYFTDMVNGNVRLSHASTTATAGKVLPDSYPYGTPSYQPNQKFLNNAKSGVTVYDPNLPAISNGYDIDGNPTSFTNEPNNSCNYQIIYSETDAEGRTGPNIGNVPAISTIQKPTKIPEETSDFTTTFDPRAFTVFVDYTKAGPNDPQEILGQFLSLEDPAKVRDGDYFTNVGIDSLMPPSGTLINMGINKDTGILTSYYRDSWNNTWIITKSNYTPPIGSYDGNMSYIAIGRSKHVYEWIPWARRYLF